jgi:hypothetical protein
MLHGSNIVRELTGNDFKKTHSGTFENGALTNGKITETNRSDGKITSSIEGDFVVKDDVYTLNGPGTVVMPQYKITGTFREGKLEIDGTQQVFKENQLLQHKGFGFGSGSVLPEISDMENNLTFIDGDNRVVVTFNPDMGFYRH